MLQAFAHAVRVGAAGVDEPSEFVGFDLDLFSSPDCFCRTRTGVPDGNRWSGMLLLAAVRVIYVLAL